MATTQRDGTPPEMGKQEKKKERPSALRSIIAGSTAGAVEIGAWFFPVCGYLGYFGGVGRDEGNEGI